MCKRIFANQTSEKGEVPFYKIGTIGGLPDSYISRVLFEEYKSKYNYPHKGEVMITCAGTVGKTIVFNGEDAYYQDSNIVWLSNPKQLYINPFLNYCLSRVNWNKLNSTTITRIYNDNLRELTINYPSVKEQEKIVTVLSLIDQRIDIQNKVIEDLKKLKAAIEDECFNQLEGKPVRLADILDERIEKSERNNQYQVLSSTVSGLYSQRDYFNKDIASSDNTGYKIIRRGDIVLSPQNLWMGNINYNNKFDIGIVSPSYKVFSIKPLYDSRFVASLLKTKKALWEYSLVSEQGASIVRRNLSMNSFMVISFTIPNRKEQEKIGDAITTINRRIELEDEYLTNIIRQKCYLLNGLFI
jgi:type I restriction enzyme S subunit